jgi:glycosyltransferase involved in cell wall biosynthesis
MRILISAISCGPHQGSEPGIGWGVVREVAARHSVCVLTNAGNRRHIEQELAAGGMPGARFVFVGLPFGLQCLASAQCYGYLHYFLWQLWAFHAARRLHREQAFDLVHHVTYGNSWAPSFMGRLGIPFVWSAGGKEVTPWRFLSILSWRSRILEGVRNLAVKVFGALTHYCTASQASLILSCSDPSLWDSTMPVRQFLLGGLDAGEMARLQRLPERSGGPCRLASIGRLEGWKGISLALAAFAAVHKESPDSEYWIIGDGSERQKLDRLARRLGCRNKVRFVGWLPRAALLEMLSEVDVLVHPSLHEQFGYVALEAMAAGRPVICLASGGCGRLVSDAGGITIPMLTPDQVVADLSSILLELARDPAKRLQKGRHASRWVAEQWHWGHVGERLETLYQEVRQRVHRGVCGREASSSGDAIFSRRMGI